MRDDDLEERLRRALHAQLDNAEPPAGRRVARPRAASRAPFGLLVVAISAVLVAAFAGPRLAGFGGMQGVASAEPATATAAPAVGATAAVNPGPGPGGALLPGPSSMPAGTATGEASVSPTPAATVAYHAATPPPVPVAPLPAATLRPSPRSTLTPTPGPAGGTIVVTSAQAGQTIHLAIGERLVLQLGTTDEWSIQLSPAGVLVAAPTPLPAGQQGAWTAERAGTVEMRLVGNPYCLQLQPPCGMPSQLLTVTVVVR
jgi:hypothetical protein